MTAVNVYCTDGATAKIGTDEPIENKCIVFGKAEEACIKVSSNFEDDCITISSNNETPIIVCIDIQPFVPVTCSSITDRPEVELTTINGEPAVKNPDDDKYYVCDDATLLLTITDYDVEKTDIIYGDEYTTMDLVNDYPSKFATYNGDGTITVEVGNLLEGATNGAWIHALDISVDGECKSEAGGVSWETAEQIPQPILEGQKIYNMGESPNIVTFKILNHKEGYIYTDLWCEFGIETATVSGDTVSITIPEDTLDDTYAMFQLKATSPMGCKSYYGGSSVHVLRTESPSYLVLDFGIANAVGITAQDYLYILGNAQGTFDWYIYEFEYTIGVLGGIASVDALKSQIFVETNNDVANGSLESFDQSASGSGRIAGRLDGGLSFLYNVNPLSQACAVTSYTNNLNMRNMGVFSGVCGLSNYSWSISNCSGVVECFNTTPSLNFENKVSITNDFLYAREFQAPSGDYYIYDTVTNAKTLIGWTGSYLKMYNNSKIVFVTDYSRIGWVTPAQASVGGHTATVTQLGEDVQQGGTGSEYPMDMTLVLGQMVTVTAFFAATQWQIHNRVLPTEV